MKHLKCMSQTGVDAVHSSMSVRKESTKIKEEQQEQEDESGEEKKSEEKKKKKKKKKKNDVIQ